MRDAAIIAASSVLSLVIATVGMWAAVELLDGKPQHDLRTRPAR